MVRSLALKGEMLGITAVILFVLGWPMPERPMQAAPGVTIQGPMEALSTDSPPGLSQPGSSRGPLEPPGDNRSLLDINRASREELRTLHRFVAQDSGLDVVPPEDDISQAVEGLGNRLSQVAGGA
jgi:hypothetical protein